MLTSAGCRGRVARLLDRLDPNLDGVVVSRPEHVYYLSGYLPAQDFINHRAPAYLLIDREGATTLVLDGWAKPREPHFANDVVHGSWRVETSAATRAAAAATAALTELEARKLVRVAAEVSHLPAHVAAAIETPTDVEPILEGMRRSLDPDELDCIRRALVAAEAMHAAARDLLTPGQREIDLYAQIVARGTMAIDQPLVMMCDFASGDRVSQGGPPSERRIEPGDNLLLDLFPFVGGYRCDITNTLNAGGRPSAEQTEAFEAALDALHAAEAVARPGTPASEIFRAQEQALRQANPGWRLVHHAGHALGLEHPEPPDFRADVATPIERGMVITFEPGVYGPRFQGVRIEHNYLVTATGLERLSHHAVGLN